MIAYEKLLNWPFPVIEHKVTQRDTMLYALGIGLGADPLDQRQLRFVYEKELLAFPSMASILCHPGNWLRNSRTGVDYLRMVNAGTSFEIHRPLPTEGTFTSTPRVLEIIDKGAGKGAIITVERNVYDKISGALVCTVTTMSLCRGDGGFGGPDHPVLPPLPCPNGPPDASVEHPTARNLALLYRLNGDQNPLHADPEIARNAGFSQPILHGLATLGVATHALLVACCGYDAERLKRVSVRYTAPVIPGDTIRTDVWRAGAMIRFRSIVPARNTVVLDYGSAGLRT